MKIQILLATTLFLSLEINAQNIKDFKKPSSPMNKATIGNSLSFSEEDAANALKEALSKGASKGADLVSAKDGYLGNPSIKIPFPPDAKKVEDRLRAIGLHKECDDVVTSLNRAAEDAGSASKDIFLSAIKSMSVTDAISIVKGANTAGTDYLKSSTNNQLIETFKPIIEKSLEKTGATKNWEIVINRYNKIPMVEKMNPDLAQYATERAIQGLFVMVANEEKNIRENPAARTSETLRKVFGK
jgi:hypothetical protein